MLPVLILALFILGGLQTHRMIERKHRKRWIRLEHVVDPEPARPFRAGAGPSPTKLVVTRDQAPAELRKLALWSFYMGQMAIPGGLLGLLGLLVAGVGIVAVPGMILAIRIWRLGVWLLRKDERAEQEARSLAAFAIGLNIVAIAAGVVVATIAGDPEAWLLPAVLAAYGAVSFAHAKAMLRCAAFLAADRARDEADANPDTDADQPTRADEEPEPGLHARPWGWTEDTRARATRPAPRA